MKEKSWSTIILFRNMISFVFVIAVISSCFSTTPVSQLERDLKSRTPIPVATFKPTIAISSFKTKPPDSMDGASTVNHPWSTGFDQEVTIAYFATSSTNAMGYSIRFDSGGSSLEDIHLRFYSESGKLLLKDPETIHGELNVYLDSLTLGLPSPNSSAKIKVYSFFVYQGQECYISLIPLVISRV